MKKKIAFCLALALTFALLCCGCGKTNTTSTAKTTAPGANAADSGNSSDNAAPAGENPVAVGDHPLVLFTMKNGDTFKMELYPEYAPKTVENFVKLVSEGFYNGLTFHRVCDGFMAQGGDPEGTGSPVSSPATALRRTRFPIRAAWFPWRVQHRPIPLPRSSSSAMRTLPSWTAIMPRSARSSRAWRPWMIF